MARTRPTPGTPAPTPAPGVGPLVAAHPAAPAVTVVLATRPAAHLRSGARRSLARLVSGAERRLSRTVPPSEARARLLRRLWRLADEASRAPAREGLALVATPAEGRRVTLHHPVVDRILVGPAPTYEDVVAASWGFGRVAVLRLSRHGARLICAEGASLWEPRPPWDPLGPVPVGEERVDALLDLALPGRTPVVIAGDDRLVRSFHRADDPRVVGHLPGDHSETAPATLAALAQRSMRSSLDDRQRAAMVDLALALTRGDAVRGPDAVAAATPGPHLLLVEVDRDGRSPRPRTSPVAARVVAAGGTVVAVPTGFLAGHDGTALVLRTAPATPEVGLVDTAPADAGRPAALRLPAVAR